MEKKKITREQAQKIVDGMSYAEVLRMIAVLETAKQPKERMGIPCIEEAHLEELEAQLADKG